MKELFNKQIEIQKIAFDVNLPEHKPELVRYFALGLMSEVGEVLQADKTWKPFNVGVCNGENVKEELADCYLFLMNLCLAEGFTAEQMIEMIRNKQEVVLQRIRRDKECKSQK